MDAGKVVVGLVQDETAVDRPRRCWPGVQLGLITAELELPRSDSDAAAAAAAAAAPAEGEAEAEAKAAAAVVEEGEDAAEEGSRFSEEIESYLTAAHRTAIQSRDETHTACVAQVRQE